jgi:tripartite-type tricarboxylate transporter receptor subunit TctC
MSQRPLQRWLSRLARPWAAGLMLGALALTAVAGPWPERPVRIVVPYPAGGLTDVVTRVVAEELGRQIGKPVVVENKSGAGGMIGLQAVLQAPRDGHTIALVVPATMITLPLTSSSYKIKPLQDFEPITAAVDTFLTLVVSPSLGIKTLPDFVAYARRNEGKLNYGTPGAGTSFHLNNLLMARKLGIRATHVPYQGEVQFLNDVASGVLQYALVSSAGKTYIDNGRVVPLAMTAPARSSSLPNVPTFGEQSVDFTTDGWVGYALASGTPPEAVEQVSAALMKAIRSPAASKRLSDMGFIVVGNDRASFKASILRSTKTYEELVTSGEVKVQ